MNKSPDCILDLRQYSVPEAWEMLDALFNDGRCLRARIIIWKKGQRKDDLRLGKFVMDYLFWKNVPLEPSGLGDGNLFYLDITLQKPKNKASKK